MDSLNPFRHDHGFSLLIDNCSLTANIKKKWSTIAQLGSRKWAPHYDTFSVNKLMWLWKTVPHHKDHFSNFFSVPIYGTIEVCVQLRMNINISIPSNGYFVYLELHQPSNQLGQISLAVQPMHSSHRQKGCGHLL